MAFGNSRMVSEEVRYLLSKHRIKPHTEAGQHFLIDEDVFRAILEAAHLGSNDRVLEIGAGVGTLTARLASYAAHTLAVEIDPQFKPILDRLSEVNKTVTIYFGDFLQMPFDAIRDSLRLDTNTPYLVVANIPYYITARLIRRLMSFPVLPQRVLILVQREVAERIVAANGHHSKLSLAVHFYGTPTIIRTVAASSFYPQPEVESALLSIMGVTPWHHKIDERFVWQIITFGFSAKRKKVCSNLAAGLRVPKKAIEDALIAAGVSPEARAEHMRPEEWVALAEGLHTLSR